MLFQFSDAIFRFPSVLFGGNMKPRQISLRLGVFALALAVLACKMNIGGPSYPAPAIPISTEAVGELQSSLEIAVAAGTVSGQVTLTFSEPQFLVPVLQTPVSVPAIDHQPAGVSAGRPAPGLRDRQPGFLRGHCQDYIKRRGGRPGPAKDRVSLRRFWPAACPGWAQGYNHLYCPGSLHRSSRTGSHRLSASERLDFRWHDDHCWANKIALGLYQQPL